MLDSGTGIRTPDERPKIDFSKWNPDHNIAPKQQAAIAMLHRVRDSLIIRPNYSVVRRNKNGLQLRLSRQAGHQR